MVEDAVIGEIRRMIATPEVKARALATLKADMPDVDDKAVIACLSEFDKLWAALFPAEQARIVQLLVARVTVGTDGLAIDLRHDGIGTLAHQMMPPQPRKDAA
jgi:site-specific DNA recombinase